MKMSKFDYEYSLLEGIYMLDGERHVGYGISVKCISDCKEVIRIEDITASRDDLLKLTKLCNELCLSPSHIWDVIEDFIL